MRIFLRYADGSRQELKAGQEITGRCGIRAEIENGEGAPIEAATMEWIGTSLLTRLPDPSEKCPDPRQDTRPVTPEWCETAGLYDSAYAQNQKRYEISGDAIRIMFKACAGPELWHPELWVGTHMRIDNPDRGRIIRLGDALKRDWPAALFAETFKPQTKLGALLGREGTIVMDKPEPDLPNAEASGPQPNGPNIPGIYSVIRRFALDHGLTLTAAIDAVNERSTMDKVQAAEIKVQIIDYAANSAELSVASIYAAQQIRAELDTARAYLGRLRAQKALFNEVFKLLCPNL